MNHSFSTGMAITGLIVSLGSLSATAETWHVPGEAPTIQGGVDSASAGDTVLVACGIYFEHDIAMKSGVTLLSEMGQPDCVTIDAQQLGRVIYCRFITSETRIEGFTITGGNAVDNPAGSEEEDGNGGGLYCLDLSSPMVVNCVLTENHADSDGGGVCCDLNSSPTFVSCTVSNNTASNGGAGLRFNNNSNTTLIDCTVSDNMGTGIWTGNFSAPEITNCVISGNAGEGIYHAGPPFGTPAKIVMTDCTISNNNGSPGGGMRFWNVAAELTNCSFAGNTSTSDGGGMSLDGASVTLTKCTLSGNSAGSYGGGVYLKSGSYLAAEGTDFDDNTAGIDGAHGFIEDACEALLTCSVSDLTGFAGSGIITVDNEGCPTLVRETSWGRLKASYE
jgi:parallel beta-helix repeat protein